MVGIVGIFKPLVNKFDYKIVILVASLIGGVGKFLIHFLSGILLWPEFPGQPILERSIYSLTYNGTYMFPTIIACSVISFLLSFKFKEIFKIEK